VGRWLGINIQVLVEHLGRWEWQAHKRYSLKSEAVERMLKLRVAIELVLAKWKLLSALSKSLSADSDPHGCYYQGTLFRIDSRYSIRSSHENIINLDFT
jgi:hypothetical protein